MLSSSRDSDAHCHLGRSRKALGHTESAGSLCRAAVGLNRESEEKSSKPPLLLETMLFRQQRFEQAKTLLWEVLQDDPDSPGWDWPLSRPRISPVIALESAAALSDPITVRTTHLPGSIAELGAWPTLLRRCAASLNCGGGRSPRPTEGLAGRTSFPSVPVAQSEGVDRGRVVDRVHIAIGDCDPAEVGPSVECVRAGIPQHLAGLGVQRPQAGP